VSSFAGNEGEEGHKPVTAGKRKETRKGGWKKKEEGPKKPEGSLIKSRLVNNAAKWRISISS
jgi:hypothetical protein